MPVTCPTIDRALRWPGRFLGFEFGDFGPLTVRREKLHLGLARPVRLLYASDLHLGHWWTRRVVTQFLAIVANVEPDVVLLGGDLVDHSGALAELHELVEALSAQAQVGAIPGNHDARAGLDAVRATVVAAGACWLPDAPMDHPIRIDGEGHRGPRTGPILCAHYPDVFPRAIGLGYRLVLAGHLHGGQCVLATHRDKLYPAAWIHRWHGLRFNMGDSAMLVSRGVGDTFPMRFNCPREVILCELE
jgi:uncharacterized protein